MLKIDGEMISSGGVAVWLLLFIVGNRSSIAVKQYTFLRRQCIAVKMGNSSGDPASDIHADCVVHKLLAHIGQQLTDSLESFKLVALLLFRECQLPSQWPSDPSGIGQAKASAFGQFSSAIYYSPVVAIVLLDNLWISHQYLTYPQKASHKPNMSL